MNDDDRELTDLEQRMLASYARLQVNLRRMHAALIAHGITPPGDRSRLDQDRR